MRLSFVTGLRDVWLTCVTWGRLSDLRAQAATPATWLIFHLLAIDPLWKELERQFPCLFSFCVALLPLDTRDLPALCQGLAALDFFSSSSLFSLRRHLPHPQAASLYPLVLSVRPSAYL